MFAEYLEESHPAWRADWSSAMPGVRVCRFTVMRKKNGTPHILPPRINRRQFEILFCCCGTVTLAQKWGRVLLVEGRNVLLLSDPSSLRAVQISGPLEGILVAVDRENTQEGLDSIQRLLGGGALDMRQVERRMENQQGCAVLGGGAWYQSAFEHLEGLPREEQGRYSLLKSVEMIYLLCTSRKLLDGRTKSVSQGSYLDRTVAEIGSYMGAHLGEKLTIAALSRQFCISPTAFKERFRRLYGQAVHSWLLEQRMKRAGELLRTSPMTVLQVAQAVGYEGSSQFNVAFRRRFGLTPKQYAKMSETGEI